MPYAAIPPKARPQKPVISTEAAHGIFVSSAAEKSASLPPPFAIQQSALVFSVLFFFSPFLARKTHVKSRKHSTPYQPTRSAWHFSFTPSGIMDLEIRKEKSPDSSGDIFFRERSVFTRNSFVCPNLAVTLLL
jgi:hypothetical protein